MKTLWSAVLWAQFVLPPPSPPKDPPPQPIRFSHRTHAAQRIQCIDCHSIKAPGDQAGFPSERTCMGCHASIKTDSPEIKKLAEYAARDTPVPWVRVYRLPKTIYFSHQVHHRKANVDCAVCHGPVADRELIGQEKSVAMTACMACHDQYKASNDCALCHDSF